MVLLGSSAYAVLPVASHTQEEWRSLVWSVGRPAIVTPTAYSGKNPIVEGLIVAYNQLSKLVPATTDSHVQMLMTNLPYPVPDADKFYQVPSNWTDPYATQYYPSSTCSDPITLTCTSGLYGAFTFENYISTYLPYWSTQLKGLGATINVLLMENRYLEIPSNLPFDGLPGKPDAGCQSEPPVTPTSSPTCVGTCDACFEWKAEGSEQALCRCVSSTGIMVGSQPAVQRNWTIDSMLTDTRNNTCHTHSPTPPTTLSPTNPPSASPSAKPTTSPTKPTVRSLRTR
jgi:hypothetical protein